MGRLHKNIDEEAVAELAFAGCSTNEIALGVGCDDQTLHRRFAKVVAKKRAERRKWLRDQQNAVANKGNPAIEYYVGTQDAHFQFSEMVLICVAGWFGRSGMSCPSVCPMRGSCLTRSFRHCDYGPFAAASWASPRSRWRNCLASPGRPSRGGGPPTPRTAWKPSPANAPAARLAPVAPSSTAKRRGSGRSLTRRAPRR